MDALAAKVSPAAALAGVSRDDIRNTLHTHFRSRPAGAGGRGDARAVTRKQRVFAFVQVQKRKAALGLGVGPKRLFATGGGVPKQYILCVTAQDGGAGAAPSAQLHYVQFLRSLAVDVRQSWDIARLDVIENHGLTTDKKRGAFALLFEGEDQPWQWLVHDAEPATAMAEFLWSLCALAVDQKVQDCCCFDYSVALDLIGVRSNRNPCRDSRASTSRSSTRQPSDSTFPRSTASTSTCSTTWYIGIFISVVSNGSTKPSLYRPR